MLRWARSSIVSLALCIPAFAAPAVREAPNPSAAPVNQLSVAGNACGPAALLNAFRFGNADWQRAAGGIAGDTDKERMLSIIREVGMRPSAHIKGRPRWSRKGVNLADLCDIANELTMGKFLPKLTQEVLFRKPGESPEELLARVHRRLDTSLAKGLPPVISVRRYALRKQDGKPPQWIALDAHFVTVFSIPGKLEKNSRAFPVTYIDPWGGKMRTGNIAISPRPLLAAQAADSPCLEAVFPDSAVGKKLVRAGEPNALALAAALGRW